MSEPASPSPESAKTPVTAPIPVPAATPWFYSAWDMLLTAMTLGLAFLIASFAVRNSDFWQYLSAGRLLSEGNYSFGNDPFGYGQPEKYWVNHAWGFDWIIYQLYSKAGAPALVMLKALGIALMAGIVFLTARKGQPLWLFAVCTSLGILIAGPRLLLQPTLFSMAGVAATVVILLRVDSTKWKFLFPVIFCLWANVDQWFILGPAILLLLFIGDLLKKSGRQSGIAMIVSSLACLVNPHHYHVWQIPAELTSETLREVLTLPEYRAFFRGLLDDGVLSFNLQSGVVPQTLAFILLTLMTLIGFLTNLRRLHLGHVFILVLLFVVALRFARALPFLGMAMAPIAAHYLAMTADRLRTATLDENTRRSLRTARLGGRFITTILMAGLLFASWPGWLHVNWDIPQRAQRVAWEIEVDNGLERAALQLKEWRDSGKIPPEVRSFIFSPDFSYYCDWFCPGERHYFDFRFTHNLDIVENYVAAVMTTRPTVSADFQLVLSDFNLKAFFEKLNVGFVAWSSGSREENLRGLSLLLRVNYPKNRPDSPMYQFWDTKGRVNFLGFNAQSSLAPEKYAAMRFDPVRQAFTGDTSIPMSTEPVTVPTPVTFWEDYHQRPRKFSSYVDEAANLVEFQLAQFEKAYSISQNACVISALLSNGLSGALLREALLTGRVVPPLPHNSNLLATPLLAVRAARRAILENPDAPDGYYYLARAYAPNEGGLDTTEELRGWMVGTGYHRALARTTPQEQHRRRQVNYYGAAERLYGLHISRNEYDLAVEAYELMLKSFWIDPPVNLRTDKERQEFYTHLQNDIRFPSREGQQIHPRDFIKKIEDRYENLTRDNHVNDPYDRGMIAASPPGENRPYFGLIREAINEFQKVDWDKETFAKRINGLLFLSTLYFRSGQVEEAYQVLGELQKSDELMKNPQFQIAYIPLFIQAKFVQGELDDAINSQRNFLSEMLKLEGARLEIPLKILPPEVWEIAMSLTFQPSGNFVSMLQLSYFSAIQKQRNLLVIESEIMAKLGLMALDAGHNQEALRFFEKSLKPRAGVGVEFPSKAIVKRYLSAMNSVK
ncbi:hypothetical protein KIH39_16730 [Telmatocola sphagniphila]|uniref:Tetratricopeptide repeat protein n=1 Tax=Telmatocola sphagniphila TaxID=1123043 RepID=A0A8E6B308_9BACT|nr:hypothetical protein [Telmatocola sphagniphila]QVL30494.1 hypothetical protein KIH39_16730 [Telmatocola sphagniphila]